MGSNRGLGGHIGDRRVSIWVMWVTKGHMVHIGVMGHVVSLG